MRRVTGIFLFALLLCAALFSVALGETAYPASQGTATDLAGVLGEATIADLSALSQRLEAATKGKCYVITRHFLGGADARAYARGLFNAWGLGEEDGLLLLVIGEEGYALALGSRAEKALPADAQTALLATHFRSAYLKREYDAAVADFSAALSQALAKAEGKSVKTAGLFGQADIQATPAPQAWDSFRADMSTLWQDMFGEEEAATARAEEAREERKTNWKTILIWGLVIYFLFFRKKRRYNFGHGPKGKRR